MADGWGRRQQTSADRQHLSGLQVQGGECSAAAVRARPEAGAALPNRASGELTLRVDPRAFMLVDLLFGHWPKRRSWHVRTALASNYWIRLTLLGTLATEAPR